MRTKQPLLQQRLDQLIEKQLQAAKAELLPARRDDEEPGPADPVEIVVPIYNGFDAVQRCVHALRTCTDDHHSIVLIDDASSDPRVAPWLDQSKRADARIEIRRNDRNRGYLATVNSALLAGRSDVVLLNSDAEVTPGWLDRLARAARADGVGIACPVTDQPGPLSVLPKASVDDGEIGVLLARLRAAIGGDRPRLPVAVGFCMYLRRPMLDQIGVFDPAFAPGYGEENEFSMRAWHAGFAVVACPDVLVRHSGGASFGRGDEVIRRQAVHGRLVNARWPGHDDRIREWWRDWPLRSQALRLSVDTADARPRMLHVLHRVDRLGGTEIHTVALARALSPWLRCSLVAPERLPGQWQDQSLEHVAGLELIRCNGEHIRPNQRLLGSGIDLSDPGVERRFLRMLEAGRWPLVHFHSLLNWNSLLLPQLARRAGARVVISLHSLEALCADFTLVPPELGRSCGKRYAGIDADCLACLEPRLLRRRGAPETPLPTYLASRRHFWQRALENADLLIAPSQFALERISAAFNCDLRRRAVVVPHGLPTPSVAAGSASGGQSLAVGFLGGCSVAKGIRLILSLAKDPRLKDLQFHIHGHIDRSVLPAALPSRVTMHGPYTPDRQPEVLSGLDLVLLPSQIEETFSLLLSECRAAAVPVAASRIGALAERVHDGADGWLLPPGDERAWADLLVQLSAPAGRRQLTGIRRHLLGQSTRSMVDNARDYAALYQQLLAQPTLPQLAGRRAASGSMDIASRRLLEQRPNPAPVESCRDLLPVPGLESENEWGHRIIALVFVDDHNRDLLDECCSGLVANGFCGEIKIVDRADAYGESLLQLHRRLTTAPETWCLLLEAGDMPLSHWQAVLLDACEQTQALLADQVLADRDGRCHSTVVASEPDRVLSLSGAEPVAGLCVRAALFAEVAAEELASPALGYLLLLAALRVRKPVRNVCRVLVRRADRNLSPGQSESCLVAHRTAAEVQRVLLGWPGTIIGNGAGCGWRFQPAPAPSRTVAIRIWGAPAAAAVAAEALRNRMAESGFDIGVVGQDTVIPACERIVLIHAAAEALEPDLFERLLAWLEIDVVAIVAPRREDMLGEALACGWSFDGHRLRAIADPARVDGCSLAQASAVPRSVPGLSPVCLALRADSVTVRDLTDLVDPDLSRSLLAQQRWRRSGHLLWIPDAAVRQAGSDPNRVDAPPGVRRVLTSQGLEALDRAAVISVPAIHARLRPGRGAGSGNSAPRVAALTRDHWAPSRYRIDLPLGDLLRAGLIAEPAIWRWSLESAPSLFEVAELAPSAMLFHDTLDDQTMDLQVAIARYLPRTRRIVVVDDLLTDLPPWHPSRAAFDPDIASRLERLIRACDLLVVTSSGLARAYGPWARQVQVIENALPEQPWQKLADASVAAAVDGNRRRPRVGWVGAQQHQGDLALIDAVVRERPDLDWQFFGMAPAAVRAIGATCSPMVSFDAYAERLAEIDLDIALVPLAEHPFNHCKSALKLMELGALGTAVIASDREPYRIAPVIRVADDPQSWLHALDRLLAAPDQRRDAGRRLQRWTLEGQLARHRRGEWLAALGLDEPNSERPGQSATASIRRSPVSG